MQKLNHLHARILSSRLKKAHAPSPKKYQQVLLLLDW